MAMNEKILSQAKTALKQRLENSNNYNQDEIDKITKIDISLIGKDTVLDKKSTEILRSLCSHSNFDKELSVKKSHRKYIGAVIYNAKKLLARLNRVILKKQLKQIENIAHYNTAAIINLYKKDLNKKT